MDYIFIWNVQDRKYRLRIPATNVTNLMTEDDRTITAQVFNGQRSITKINDYETVLSGRGNMGILARPEDFDRYIASHVCLDLKEQFLDYLARNTREIYDNPFWSSLTKEAVIRFLGERVCRVSADNIYFDITSVQGRTARLRFHDLPDTKRMKLLDHGIREDISFDW